jgi:hypothetical protein
VLEDGKPKNLDEDGYVSFQSVENGLKGLTIYNTVRYQEDTIKMALILEGEEGQIYKFETGVDTTFGRGMLWALSHLGEEDISGRIGINPMPGDDLDSRNAQSLLFCNMYVNGVELPRLPKETEAKKMDWQTIAHRALCIANRCDYPIAEVPHNSVFWDRKTAGQAPATQPQQQQQQKQTAQPAKKAQQPAKNTSNERSGVSYPQQPLKSQQAPAQQTAPQVQQVKPAQQSALLSSDEDLHESYNQLMDYVGGEYGEQNVDLDESRINTFIERAGVKFFADLTKGRKHQLVSTLAAELIEAVDPQNSTSAKIKAIVTPSAVNWEAYTMLSDLIVIGFTEIKHPPKPEENPQPGSPSKTDGDGDGYDPIPF